MHGDRTLATHPAASSHTLAHGTAGYLLLLKGLCLIHQLL